MPTTKYPKWLTVLSAVLGVWVIATPFVWSIPETMLYSNVAAGAIITLVAGYGAYLLSQDEPIHLAIPVITGVLGLWVLVSPFAFGEIVEAALASNVIAGILVFAMAAYVGYVGREEGYATSGGATV